MQTIDLKTASLNDLKALAYDMIAAREDAERKLQMINQEIITRANAQPVLTSEEKLPE